MYFMRLLDHDKLIVTQRYYNLLKTYYTFLMEYGTDIFHDLLGYSFKLSIECECNEFGSNTITFQLGDEVFVINELVHTNLEWDKWVKTQPIRCMVYSKEQFASELMEFLVDYYPDYIDDME